MFDLEFDVGITRVASIGLGIVNQASDGCNDGVVYRCSWVVAFRKSSSLLVTEFRMEAPVSLPSLSSKDTSLYDQSRVNAR